MADENIKIMQPISERFIGERLKSGKLLLKTPQQSFEKPTLKLPSPAKVKVQPDHQVRKTAVAPPQPPASDPLQNLPFPNPGDRIRSDDFKTLSQAIRLISDTFALTGTLFGRSLAQAIAVLEAGKYEIASVMTVFGAELERYDDPSLEKRKVIQVTPVQLGRPDVVIVVSEAVETRRFAPNLLGLTYRDASERLHNIMGDVSFPSRPINASELVGLKLSAAQAVMHSK